MVTIEMKYNYVDCEDYTSYMAHYVNTWPLMYNGTCNPHKNKAICLKEEKQCINTSIITICGPSKIQLLEIAKALFVMWVV